ncbi:hypothetical protein SEVIR_7G082767v4 [Setaria viridis]
MCADVHERTNERSTTCFTATTTIELVTVPFIYMIGSSIIIVCTCWITGIIATTRLATAPRIKSWSKQGTCRNDCLHSWMDGGTVARVLTPGPAAGSTLGWLARASIVVLLPAGSDSDDGRPLH